MWQGQDRSMIHISDFRRWHGSGVAAALYRGGKITMQDAAAIIGVPVRTALQELGERGVYIRYGMELNFGNPKNSRSHPIILQIPKYRRLNPTQNRYQPTPRNILNFAFIPRCRGKVLASHRTAAPRFSRF